ncbi:uncharacterized protein LOC125679931 [Ostrea edulis]|uniref:uncharacterized protein LOC125679931 n=1 Tax=Ostrea edulis TaxID=37623 RepID=UPI0024AEC274|nr:uncharacterized protein LOC125679931 [Ostrea edulis]
MENGGAQAPVNCDLCEMDSFANWKCMDCQQRLCDSCYRYHLKLAGTKHHTILSFLKSSSEGQGQNISLQENDTGKTMAVEIRKTHPKIEEILEKVDEKETALSMFDHTVDQYEKYRSEYDRIVTENKAEISELGEKLRENLESIEKEMIHAIDEKYATDKTSLEHFIKETQTLKEKHTKQVKYIRQILSSLQDADDDTVEQFAKDTLPKLAAMQISSSAATDLPKPLKIEVGKQSLRSVVGTLVEDKSFDSDQKTSYRNEFEFELKFKPENGRSSIYSIQIRPDGKAWVTTLNYRVYLVLRSGHIHQEYVVKFLPTYTTVNRFGNLFCSSGQSAIHVIKPDYTITEFENLAPYNTFGLHTNKDDQLLVCLQKSNTPGKVAIFSDKGMLLKEICLDSADQPMFSAPRYVTETSKGDVCVVDNKHLIVVDASGKSCSKYKPEEDWEGKSIIVDSNDNLLSAVCPLEFVPLTVHVTSVKGRVLKRFTLEGPGMSGINALAIDQQYEEPVLWIGTPNGHVLVAKFLDA